METFPAGDAVLFPDRFHVRGEAAFGHLKDICSRNIHAGLDAAEAHDATVKPLSNQRGPVGNRWNFPFFRRKLFPLNSKFMGSVLELASPPGIADRTVDRMFDK